MTEDELLGYARMKLEEWQAEREPTIAPGLLDAFEERHGVRLPSLYRRIVSEVAGGWDTWDDGCSMLGGVAPFRDRPNAGRPFPLVAARNADEIEPDVEEAILGGHGSIPLGSEVGGDVEHFLVLNGPARGQVWMRSPDLGVGPCAPPRDFASWFELWIDGRIDALNQV